MRGKRLFRKIRAQPLLFLGVFPLFAPGCSNRTDTRSSASSHTQEFIVAIDPDTLDPRFAVDVVGMRASRLLHAGLFQPNPDTLAPEPNLARSYLWKNETTLVVELNTDRSWSNGLHLSSADVIATFEALRSTAVGSRHQYLVAPIVAIEAEGETRVVFHLRAPRAGLLSDLEFPILRRDQASSPLGAHTSLDGLGPFRVESVGAGEVTLSPRTTAPAPPKKGVVLRTIRDENARALRLLAGKAEIAQNTIAPSLLASVVTDSHGALEVRRHAGASTTYLLLHTEAPPLDDANYRCAIAENIDRALLTSTLLEGTATPATSLIPEGHWAHLAENKSVFLPGAHKLSTIGDPIAILTSTERTRMLVGRTIAERLTRIGIPTDARPLELGTLIARLNAGHFDAAILQFPEFTDPSLLRLFLHSDAIPPAGSNRARLRDETVDRLLDLGDRTLELQARKHVYHALEARLRALCVMIPLWHEDNVALVARSSTFLPGADGRYTGLAK